jgi:hypothetical protein
LHLLSLTLGQSGKKSRSGYGRGVMQNMSRHIIQILAVTALSGCTTANPFGVTVSGIPQNVGPSVAANGRFQVIATWEFHPADDLAAKRTNSHDVMLIDSQTGDLYLWSDYHYAWPGVPPVGADSDMWWLYYEGRLRPGTTFNQILEEATRTQPASSSQHQR